MSVKQYFTETFGEKDTDTFRVFFKKRSATSETYISPFHDIPLHNEHGHGVYRMVVEIPRWENAKMSISKTETFNPIRQELKNGHLRYVDNCFPYHGYIWNYGSMPQTWEMPSHQDPITEGLYGDNDPVDVIDIGTKIHPIGSVLEVKVLGALGMVENKELDWKIVVIEINDPLAILLNDINDCYLHLPGLLEATIDWFRFSEVPSGSPISKFAFNDTFLDKNSALDLVESAHKNWKSLIMKELNELEKKDAEFFKLFNTQYELSFEDYKKNEFEAGLMVENFKKLILDRAPEVIVKKPSLIRIDEVFYLEKDKLFEDLKKGITYVQIEKKNQEEEENRKKGAANRFWSTCLRDQKYYLLIPILGGYYAFNYIYKS